MIHPRADCVFEARAELVKSYTNCKEGETSSPPLLLLLILPHDFVAEHHQKYDDDESGGERLGCNRLNHFFHALII